MCTCDLYSEPVALLCHIVSEPVLYSLSFSAGLGVSIFSYGGFVRVGVLADKVLMDKPRFIIEEFLKKVDELVRLLKLE